MKKLACCAVGFALMAGSAAAGPLATTVTALGNYGNDLSVINDGVFPPDGYFFADPDAVYFGPSSHAGPTAVFTFDFGGAFSITSFAAAVDNNDDYSFVFFNGVSVVGADTITAAEGHVPSQPGGLETFSRPGGDVLATSVRVSGFGGDGFYSIGEVQFNAVPEPATWAMMLLGFAGLGTALRRRRAGPMPA
jgi:hypothetical protein